MRAISLLEPDATLIAIGAKRWHVCGWSPQFRGPLAIHASKKFSGVQRLRCSWPPVIGSLLLAAGILPSSGLIPTLGCVIAVVQLTDITTTGRLVSERISEPDSVEHQLSKLEPGSYAWKLEGARRITPVPCRGVPKSFFFIPDEIQYLNSEAGHATPVC